jgi:hypothetical protein
MTEIKEKLTKTQTSVMQMMDQGGKIMPMRNCCVLPNGFTVKVDTGTIIALVRMGKLMPSRETDNYGQNYLVSSAALHRASELEFERIQDISKPIP